MISKTILCALILGVALAFPHSPGQLNERNKSERALGNVGIYNGNSTKMNNHRYLVGILYQGDFLCAGIIVSASWVVTLADCTTSLESTEMMVVSNSTDGVHGTAYAVTSVVQHPDYSASTIDYDFACIQVEGTFYYWSWRAHKLPSAEPALYSTFTVAGYGYTTSGSTTRELREASMVLLPKAVCKKEYVDVDLEWTPRLRCAYNTDGATLCNGDFGDAFVSGKVLYGLFVAGSPLGFCSSSALPVVMADVYQVAEWIHYITGAEYA